jgi:hypothetical protein
MATKNVTLRLPEEMVEYLTRNNESINQAVISEINTLKRIRLVALGELKGLFTVDEWVFMINTFNSTLTDEMFCANKGAFIACCEDAEKYEGGATILNMDLSAFINKINSLKGANIEAIYSRIKDYWSHSNEIDLNEWAKF